jgi:hypothetical protein
MAVTGPNNLSITNCDNYNADYAPNIFTHVGDNYQTSAIAGNGNVHCASANDAYSSTTPDGTIYTRYSPIENGHEVDYIAAVKDGNVLWKTNIMSDPLCDTANGQQYSSPYSVSIGQDGNVYAIIRSVYSGCASYVAGYNAKTGVQSFKHYVTTSLQGHADQGTVWGQMRLWTLGDRIILLDANGLEHQYSYEGTENIAARYQFPTNITYAMGDYYMANGNGRVFVVYTTPWGCDNISGTYIHYHDLNGNSGTSTLNLGCSASASSYSYRPVANGNVAAYGYSGNVLVAHMTDDNHSVHYFPVPAGYSQSHTSEYWENASGQGLLVRQLTDANGQYTVSIDSVSSSNDNLSNVATLASNGTTFNPYIEGGPITSATDIYDNYLYIPLCHSNCSGLLATGDTWIHRIPLGNFGTVIKNFSSLADISSVDVDGDGLTTQQEASQGTSDHTTDTDGDGLSDYTESQWNPARDSVFCGSSECAYPNPTQKDLFVQVDWMQDNNSRSFKPSDTQLTIISQKLATHGITAHFDTGQYGGGNLLTDYSPVIHFASSSTDTDFYDYKAGNFDSTRYHIWHYMISGYMYSDILGSSGASYPSDDDVFISTGLIVDNPSVFHYDNLDNAIAGTIIHELGHNLCLTNPSTAPSGERSDCIFDGIDNEDGSDVYPSVMNYSFQMSNLLDYSAGLGPTGDHNDLAAISQGITDFATSTNEGTGSTSGKKIIVGVTTAQADRLWKKHKLHPRVTISRNHHVTFSR